MIVNTWTPEKTYLEASKNSACECVLPDDKRIRIPPTHGFINQGIPVILPRQVASKGHTSFFVELCHVGFAADGLRRIEHVAGARVPIETLTHMRTTGTVGHSAPRRAMHAARARRFAYGAV